MCNVQTLILCIGCILLTKHRLGFSWQDNRYGHISYAEETFKLSCIQYISMQQQMSAEKTLCNQIHKLKVMQRFSPNLTIMNHATIWINYLSFWHKNANFDFELYCTRILHTVLEFWAITWLRSYSEKSRETQTSYRNSKFSLKYVQKQLPSKLTSCSRMVRKSFSELNFWLKLDFLLQYWLVFHSNWWTIQA